MKLTIQRTQLLFCSIIAFYSMATQAQTTNPSPQASPARAQPTPATPVPPPLPVDLSTIKYPLEQAHLFEPFWKSETVYGESVAFLKEGDEGAIDGKLLFRPKKIL